MSRAAGLNKNPGNPSIERQEYKAPKKAPTIILDILVLSFKSDIKNIIKSAEKFIINKMSMYTIIFSSC